MEIDAFINIRLLHLMMSKVNNALVQNDHGFGNRLSLIVQRA